MGKNENIGLEAIFAVDGFMRGVGEYLGGIASASSSTEKASTNITAGLAAIGGTVVTGALAAGAAAIGAVTGAAIASIPALLNYVGAVDSIGDVLGTTAEESSTLNFAIKSVGGNVEAITGQMAFLTKGLVDAKGELGPTGEVLKDLGINFKDANGQMKPATEILTSVADKLASMPDGLEKSALMMKLFGKSGKDLTDTMNALTTEGFANAQKMAEELGLSLSDDTAAGAIELGKQFEILKMAGQGLMVSLGKELLPAVTDITKEFIGMVRQALPSIREALPAIGQFVTGLARTIIQAIPVAINIFRGLFDFLSQNKPIIIGVLAGLTVAIAAWAYTTIAAAVPAAIAFLTAMWPVIAIIAAVAAAAAALAWAWENNFLGIRDTLTAVWEGTVKPALEALRNWLGVVVPAAIATLSAFWTNTLLPAVQAVAAFWTGTLLPAIQTVWAFIQTNVIPLFTALAELIGTALTLAVTALAGIWENVLLPAITKVWTWISTKLQPVFEDIGAVVQDVAGWVGDHLAPAFDKVGAAIQTVIGWIKGLTDKLKNVKLPAWMTPGSPTPWQIGLEGVTAAMKELSRTGVPAIEAGLSGMAAAAYPAPSAMAAASSSPTPSAVNHSTVNNINLGGNSISSPMDMAVFEATVERVLYRILTPGTV